MENLLKSEAAFLTSLNIAIEVSFSKMMHGTKAFVFVDLVIDQLKNL